MLVITMAAVVVSFLVATTVTQYRESVIDNRVNELIGNSLPSLKYLASTRTRLLEVLETTDKAVRSAKERLPIDHQPILSAEKDMKAMFRTYLTLPLFPGEREIAADVDSLMPAFTEALRRFLETTSKVDPEAMSVARDEIHTQALLLDKALLRLSDFNAVHGQRLGLEISSIRVQSLTLAILLDLISVGLAVLATLLAIRTKNESVKALTDRAKELEIFAGRVAHDLKNPLSSILMSGGLVEEQAPSGEVKDLARRINVIGMRMNQIIDGLLEFARSGARPDTGGKANVSGVIESIMTSVRPEADKAGIAIEVEPVPKSLAAACSEGILTSVFSNLIRNALKYVVDGSDPARLIHVRFPDTSGSVRIEVEDNGPGIDSTQQMSIFDPYFRVNTKHPGLGLGLTTVKRLVETHGGSVGVRSTPGHGSCFWFELPKA
jgi:signal transduction histidine kinase